MTEDERQRRLQEIWTEQCEELGYYEVSQGYRKVPGNICEGGIDLSPYRYQCSTSGYLASFFSFRGLFTLAIIGALCYYGWPIIEAVLLLLPVPDPNEMKDTAKKYFSQGVELVKNLPASVNGDGRAPTPGYSQEFATPGSL